MNQLLSYVRGAAVGELPLPIIWHIDTEGSMPMAYESLIAKVKRDNLDEDTPRAKVEAYVRENQQELSSLLAPLLPSIPEPPTFDSVPSRSLEHRDTPSVIKVLREDEFLLSDLDDLYWEEFNEGDGEAPFIEGYELIGETDDECDWSYIGREPVYRKLPVVERHAPVEIETTSFEDDFTADSAKYSHINFTPPEAVRNAAERGLAIRKKQPKSNRGGLTNKEASKEGIGSGVQRAVNLKNGGPVSPKVVKQMKAFFDRHSAFKHKHKSEPEGKAATSWKLWGGDAGYSWAKKVVGQMEAADKSERRDAIARFNKKHNESLTEESLLADLRQDSEATTYEWVEGYNRGDSWVPGYVRYYRDRKGSSKKKVQLDISQDEALPIDLSIELSMQRGQPIIDNWIDLLGEEIGKEKSLEALLEKIPDLASKLSIEDFGTVMQEGNTLSHLIGLTEQDEAIE